jgi:hypothetical protein
MQTQPHYGFIRRFLLPYSGMEPLTRQQSVRLIVVWALVFTAPIVLCTLAATLLAAAPLYKTGLFLLIAFLGGVLIFGATAWFVVIIINRAARLVQKRNATNTSSGGRYGS